MSRTGTFRAIATIGGTVAQALFGSAFLLGGSYITYKALQHEPHDSKLVWAGIGVALFGALIFPSIFPAAQRVYVMVFPNGIPWPGGKRASDPPAPSKPQIPFDFQGPPDPGAKP